MCFPIMGGGGSTPSSSLSPFMQNMMKGLVNKLQMQRIQQAQSAVNTQLALRPADAAQMASPVPTTGRSAVDLRIPLR